MLLLPDENLEGFDNVQAGLQQCSLDLLNIKCFPNYYVNNLILGHLFL
jgi:hypothetical protein